MIGIFCRLFRLRLAVMNGIAAVGGYLLVPGNPQAWRIASVGVGVALLAGAASAFNQLMERNLDALMQRTKGRPLPTGDLAPAAVALLGAGTLLAGVGLLLAVGGPLPAMVGLATLAWYLAVYTPLKTRTPLALAVGALCGALAPVLGWSAAGGSLGDFRVMLLAGVFYLWQIPHFWLLQRRHAEDYRRAGFPLFVPSCSAGGTTPIFYLWLVAMIAGALMLPAFGVISRAAAPWCAAFFAPLVITLLRRGEPALFASVNLFPLLVTVALYVGR